MAQEVADSEVWEGAEPYWQSFLVLHRHRANGFSGIDPLTIESILAYATAFCFATTRVDLEEFCEMIDTLDRLMVDHDTKKRAAAAEAAKQQKGRQ